MTAARQGKIGRMKKRPEFLRAARKGRKWVSPGFVLQAVEAARVPEIDDPEGAIRVGFTASRKVGGAVQRNRARRRLRAAAAELLPREGRLGCDYVLIARKAAVDLPYARLLTDLERGLAKLGDCR